MHFNNREVCTLFVDLRKAYDSIHRESLLNIMKEFHFPHKLVSLEPISVMETLVRVQVGVDLLRGTWRLPP